MEAMMMMMVMVVKVIVNMNHNHDGEVVTLLLVPPGDHVGDADADHDGQCDVIYLVMI